MKNVMLVLVIILLGIGVFYLFHRSPTSARPRAATGPATTVSDQPGTVPPDSDAIGGQLAQAIVRADQLARRVENLTGEKTRVEQQLTQTRQEASELRQNLAAEKNRQATSDAEKELLAREMTSLNQRLETAQRRLAELQQTHRGTVEQLDSLRDEKNRLEMSQASLERRLNDLDALREQVRLVKRQAWDRKVAEWKKADAAASRAGNKGVLLQNGEWRTVHSTGQP
jgi:chromosome segregation ATPase